MKRITVDELWTLLRFGTGGEFFSVTFDRRTDRPDGTAIAGDERTMLCRTEVQRYKLGVIPDGARDIEDFRHAILTVWSVDAYRRNRDNGMEREDAAWNAWRRVDLTTVKRCSLMPMDDLPPDIIAEAHDITNAYRLANLPREPIAGPHME